MPPFRGVLATVGDEQITMADVRARSGDDLDQNETRYRTTQQTLVETALQDLLCTRVPQREAKK
jgi:hypothetical protein